EYLQQLQYWQKFAYGALLAVVMFALPLGIVGTAVHLFRRVRPQPRAIESDEETSIETATAAPNAGKTQSAELVANNLVVRFGGLTALNDVSIRVKPAEIHALIGPNGAGKSTFVNTVTGFYVPDQGCFELDGVDLTGAPPHVIARNGFSRT